MIPRSMPKRAIIMEIECANFGKSIRFSRLPIVGNSPTEDAPARKTISGSTQAELRTIPFMHSC